MGSVRGKISDDDLREALSLHEQWLTSQGAAGQRATFVARDLRNKDLSRCDLSRADLSDARIEAADLSHSTLTGAIFTRALLHDVNLSWSDLTDAVGLDTSQLSRCDLTGCKLPDNLKDCGELDSVESVSEIAQRHFAGILAACAYCVLTISTTRDFRLFNNTGSVQLPVVRVSLPTELFFWLAPAALISYFVYFHICLQRLWEAIVALPARFVDGSTVYQRTNRWMLNGMVRLCLRKPDEPRYALIKSQIAASVGLAYWLVPVTVALLAIRYFPRQDPSISSLHCLLFGLACGSALYFQMLAMKTLRQRRARVSNYWIVLLGAGAALLLFVPSIPRLTAGWGMSLVHVNLREAEVSTRPRNWDALAERADLVAGQPEKQDDVKRLLSPAKGVRLNGLDLRWIRAFGSFLANSNLSGANLTHGDLFKADLRGATLKDSTARDTWLYAAHLEVSDLRRADLSDSDARYADFRGAILFQTKLRRTDLRGANLTGVTVAADIEQACLSGAILDFANLSYSDLRDADLSATEVRHGRFNSAVAININLSNADLESASFQDANLIGADLRWANLKDADLERTYLLNADLRGVKNLTVEQLMHASINGDTKCPEEPTIQNYCQTIARNSAHIDVPPHKRPCETLPKATSKLTF